MNYTNLFYLLATNRSDSVNVWKDKQPFGWHIHVRHSHSRVKNKQQMTLSTLDYRCSHAKSLHSLLDELYKIESIFCFPNEQKPKPKNQHEMEQID